MPDLAVMKELALQTRDWSVRLTQGIDRYAGMRIAVDEAKTIDAPTKAAQYGFIEAETADFLTSVLADQPTYDSVAEGMSNG